MSWSIDFFKLKKHAVFPKQNLLQIRFRFLLQCLRSSYSCSMKTYFVELPLPMIIDPSQQSRPILNAITVIGLNPPKITYEVAPETNPIVPSISGKILLIDNLRLPTALRYSSLSRNTLGSLRVKFRFDFFICSFRKSKSLSRSTSLFVEHVPIIRDFCREHLMSTKHERPVTFPPLTHISTLLELGRATSSAIFLKLDFSLQTRLTSCSLVLPFEE